MFHHTHTLGGSPIFIETVALPLTINGEVEGKSHGSGSGVGGGIRIVTGQLGDVMKESVSIAYTYITTFLHSLSDQQQHHAFFNTHSVHIHVPEGAVSKDGPSAGVAMACALLRYVYVCMNLCVVLQCVWGIADMYI
ncbi:hypothetical protein EON63_21965 [archaeon]|nr:MAG: hypothetical protein EON63_21965 [archaeon]